MKHEYKFDTAAVILMFTPFSVSAMVLRYGLFVVFYDRGHMCDMATFGPCADFLLVFYLELGRTKQLNMIIQLTWPEPETDQKKFKKSQSFR